MGFEELTAKGQGRDVGLERNKVEGKFQLTRGGARGEMKEVGGVCMEGLRWLYYAPNPLRGGASKGLRWKGGLGNFL